VDELVKVDSNIRKIEFLGDYLPRKCGIATFTSDLLGAVAGDYPKSCASLCQSMTSKAATNIRT